MTDQWTIPALIARNGHDHRDRQFVVCDDAVLTHSGVDRATRTRARRLVAGGIGKSSRVGIMMPNGIEWVVNALAVMRVGATLVPLSTLLRPPELHAQLQAAKVTELIVARHFRGRAYLDELDEVAPGSVALTQRDRRHPALPALRRIWADDSLPTTDVGDDLVASLEQQVRPADDMVILFTSGSRGAPKGVIHTHGNALRATASGLACRCVGADERIYIPMPFFWTGGFSGGLMTALVAGATLVTEAVSDPDRTLDLLEQQEVTLFRGWPDQAARVASSPRFATADLSRLGPGSLPAILPASQRPAPTARANLFGMTETFGPYAGEHLDQDLPAGKWGSCGRPFDGVEVRIFDPDSGRPVDPGQRGEIGVRGPNVMRAICGRTREDTFDADGFYHTGDVGAVDADGYLWYHGRADDMFKVKGATVYPSEVEAALREIDEVSQAYVTDVADPDGGRAVAAVVVSGLPADQIAVAARERLSSFKLPTRWYVTDLVDDVPRSATGKVTKSGLQELFERGGTGSPGKESGS
jgi:acyl-CoA synthetase (AMP-forming)/AMP-acid ligase II